MKVAFALQALATLFLVTILDGGTLAKVGVATMFGFWAGVAIIIYRRPQDPSRADVLYVRWGFLAALSLGIACLPFMGTLRR